MKFNCSTPAELLKEIKDLDIKMVDMRFTDMPGTTHHFTIPVKFLDEDILQYRKILYRVSRAED